MYVKHAYYERINWLTNFNKTRGVIDVIVISENLASTIIMFYVLKELVLFYFEIKQ